MKKSKVLLIFLLIVSSRVFAQTAAKEAVSFVPKEQDKKIDILIGGKYFTSYCWYANVYKPIFFPVISEKGAEITRGFPLKPRKNERMDHLHQIGIWFNYGNVDGYDFWGNGSTGKRSSNGGEIKHLKVEKLQSGDGEGLMETHESWQDPRGKELLDEKTVFHFIVEKNTRIIDRITILTATSKTVKFKDTKEGMFAMRVARQLELPTSDNDTLYQHDKTIPVIRANSNVDVSGNYLSSEGKTGDEVWGTRARWMILSGKIGEEKISIVICDHPKNQGYPTYWHARNYGLFAANPLGAVDFVKSKDSVNFSIPQGQSRTFRFRIVISSDKFLDDASANTFFTEFKNKY